MSFVTQLETGSVPAARLILPATPSGTLMVMRRIAITSA
jgi:hypothetical protein